MRRNIALNSPGIRGMSAKIGDQPINVGLQAFDYVQAPSGAARWTLRFQVQFLFPR